MDQNAWQWSQEVYAITTSKSDTIVDLWACAHRAGAQWIRSYLNHNPTPNKAVCCHPFVCTMHNYSHQAYYYVFLLC